MKYYRLGQRVKDPKGRKCVIIDNTPTHTAVFRYDEGSDTIKEGIYDCTASNCRLRFSPIATNTIKRESFCFQRGFNLIHGGQAA